MQFVLEELAGIDAVVQDRHHELAEPEAGSNLAAHPLPCAGFA